MTMTTLDPDQVMSSWRLCKARRVEYHPDDPDMCPQMDLLLSDGTRHLGLIPEGQPAIVPGVEAITKLAGASVRSIAVMADARARQPGGEPQDVLVVSTIDPDGTVHVRMLPYVIIPGLGVCFDADAEHEVAAPQGGVVDALVEAMRSYQ